MDVNELLYHHQVSLIQASTRLGAARDCALRLVKHYQTRIDRQRQEARTPFDPLWFAASRMARQLS